MELFHVDVPTSTLFNASTSVSLKAYLCDFNCSIYLHSSLTFDCTVLSYQAVISQQKAIVNKGDFVEVNSANVKTYLCSNSLLLVIIL